MSGKKPFSKDILKIENIEAFVKQLSRKAHS